LIEMTESIDLPPEIEQVADLLSKQRPEVRDLFRYALVLAMVDDEKARVIGTRVEEREWLTVKSVAGDVFEIVRPEISEEIESELMSQVRAIVADEDGDGSRRTLPAVARRPWLPRLGGIQLFILLAPIRLLVRHRLRTYRRETLIRVQVAVSDEDRLRPTNL
jgi:hypothetical protein